MTRLLQALLLSTLFCITVLGVITESSDITTTQKLQQHQRRQHHRTHQHIHHKEHRRREHSSERLTKTQDLNEQIDFVDPKGAQPRVSNSTRLRRLTARDYYNRVVQRRQNAHRNTPTEWGYNTYNVLTNTFGTAPVGKSAGKGDDNMHDVEFISSSASSSPEWAAPNPRRGYDYMPPMTPTTTTTTAMPITRRTLLTTSAPPPLVPARRGYPAIIPPPSSNDLPHVTEDPIETNVISRNPNDSKDMEKRHICVQQRTITMPVKTTEVYTRPIWKHISTPCQPQMHANQMCTRVQLVHEQAFRDVIRHKSAQQVTYDCCNGWTRETPHTDSCMKPVCSIRCQNGGSCSAPDTCSCPKGYTGRYCEHDINECKEEKPCDQTCVNTIGAYYCKCREGFALQPDQQSCKKIDLHDDDAFEARDLENEIEAGENVVARLHKIERSLANERVQTHELQKSLQATYSVVDTLKSRLNTLEKQQQDINRLQTNLFATESRTNKLEGMLNLLLKCRNGPNANCP